MAKLGKSIMLPRDIASSSLQSKFTIDVLPGISQYKDPKLIELVKPQLDFCREAPLLWDFILNIIHFSIQENKIEDHSKDFYETGFPVYFIEEYLQTIKNKHIKTRTKYDLIHSLFHSTPRLLFRNSDNKFEYGYPVISSLLTEDFKETKVFTPKCLVRLLLQKSVFASLVEKKWQNTAGYVKIPSNLYPLIKSIEAEEENITNPIKDNPHYKLQIFSAIHHFKKETSVYIDKETFKKAILPEFYKKQSNKNLLNYKKTNPLFQEENANQHNLFSSKLNRIYRILLRAHSSDVILRNLYFEDKKVILYYTTDENRQYF